MGHMVKSPADLVLLVEMHAALVELAHLGIDSHLLNHGGIARADSPDLGIGQSAAFEVLGHAHRALPARHLLDEHNARPSLAS